MPTSVVLREYGSPVRLLLTPDERAVLARANVAWKRALGLPELPLVIEEQGNTCTIRAQQVAGSIRVGSLNIEIAPKFVDPDSTSSQNWRQAFWRILIAVSGGRATFGRASGADVAALSIADLLAEVFLESYARGSLRGMPLRYNEVTDVSTAPRGSFDARRFDTWLISPWRVPTVTDVLTDDTPLARLLGWAAVRLQPLVVVPSRARALAEVGHALAGSGNIPSLMDAERLSLGVQHDGLRQALEVALLLLRGHGISHGDGDRDVIGFLWKTADVYERFLFWLCQRASHEHGLGVVKSTAEFGTSSTHGPLRTTPDVAFKNVEGQFLGVLDAKYKQLNSSPNAADSYQVLTAANTLGCRDVGLVYPTNVPREEMKWAVRSALGGETVTISALFIEPCLADTPDGIRSLVATISEWLARLALELSFGDGEGAATEPAHLGAGTA